ncbi:HLA class II histocompatibility antigen, DR alpha chain [Sceloporus undulatus]|uniref:HLA class II histocompatibility antigen, DR alpha chain n=1 Tax=Sceloporus undulatus TaxID=8520 RepID=UPI001C4D9F31|nr:HLA class II histocompatibility antigen, DR alpha chain [Sceloporus undulatus]
METQLDFFQESFPSGKESGEFLQDFDGEEKFHVDLDRKEDVWRLPDFTHFTSFDAQGALNNLAIMKFNLGVLMKRSNRTRAQNVAPSVSVYNKGPMELGEPNVLICFVDNFSPPVVNISWLKNGEEVSEGVQETGYYRSVDFTFRKFSYLPFVPEDGDFYVCRVDHWGLQDPLTKIWYPRKPVPIPETAENVVCGLGLALGILGVIVGPILFFKARKMKEGNGLHHGSSRGPL